MCRTTRCIHPGLNGSLLNHACFLHPFSSASSASNPISLSLSCPSRYPVKTPFFLSCADFSHDRIATETQSNREKLYCFNYKPKTLFLCVSVELAVVFLSSCPSRNPVKTPFLSVPLRLCVYLPLSFGLATTESTQRRRATEKNCIVLITSQKLCFSASLWNLPLFFFHPVHPVIPSKRRFSLSLCVSVSICRYRLVWPRQNRHRDAEQQRKAALF